MLELVDPSQELGLEKYLLSQGKDERSYLLRTLSPRFIAATAFQGDELVLFDVIWWDTEPADEQKKSLLNEAKIISQELFILSKQRKQQEINDALFLAEERFDIERHNFRDSGERLEAQAEELVILAEKQQLNIAKRMEAEKALKLSEEQLQIQISELRDSEERMALQAQEMVWLAEDLQNAEQKMKFLANHDALTELPSRRFCLERLNLAMIEDQQGDTKTAVLFIDLDGFKAVNDNIGHEAGDAILVGVARRLKTIIRAADMAARFGGDEFIVLLPAVKNADVAANIADKIVKDLAKPFDYEGQSVTIGASIGIAFSMEDGQTSEQLLHNADQSMYAIKKQGKNNYGFFSDLKL